MAVPRTAFGLDKHPELKSRDSHVYKLLVNAKVRATKKNLAFNLTVDDVVIPDKCPLLGIPLFQGKGKSCPNSPTIDRIQPERGYVPGNVWVISKRANTIKNNATVAELRAIAEGVEQKRHYGKLVYFASPFTHPDKAVRDERNKAIARACGWFMNNRRDIFFFSPITHATPIAAECELPYEWQFWAEIDECMISRCEEVWVLAIPGFKKSTGVNAERKIGERLGLPLKFVIPQSDGSYVISETEPEDALG